MNYDKISSAFKNADDEVNGKDFKIDNIKWYWALYGSNNTKFPMYIYDCFSKFIKVTS